MKITVAMSGGVDSSVAAALLKEQGHEVTGATMRLRPLTGDRREDASIEDARKVAQKLGIPHYVFDFSNVFARTVIDYFCREYGQGRTPNPCVLCNRYIKFGALWEKAQGMGSDCLATGHYAAIEKSKDRFLLKKAADPKKDQSYFLYRLTQEQLSHTIFPLAAVTKDKVKQMAKEMGLPTANRPESQEICFIPDNDYPGFLKKYSPAPAAPGAIINNAGKIIGQHEGITRYTIGQRKGLGIAAAEPLYVTGIDYNNNSVTVGVKEETYTDELAAGDLNWIAITPPKQSFNAKARVRYRHQEAEATVTPVGEKEVQVKFKTPQMAVTPGQSVVFYDGETVLGGGIILKQGR
jgi:tRNA-specific 2-thiouridylase